MCGITRLAMNSFKWQFHFKVDLISKCLFQSRIPSKAIQIGVIYEDLTMSIPSFAKYFKHAIIMQEKVASGHQRRAQKDY